MSARNCLVRVVVTAQVRGDKFYHHTITERLTPACSDKIRQVFFYRDRWAASASMKRLDDITELLKFTKQKQRKGKQWQLMKTSNPR